MKNLNNQPNKYAVGLQDWLWAHQVSLAVDELDQDPDKKNLAVIPIWKENGSVKIRNIGTRFLNNGLQQNYNKFDCKDYPIKLLVPYNLNSYHFELAEIELSARNIADKVTIYNKHGNQYNDLKNIIDNKLQINLNNVPTEYYEANNNLNIIGSADGRCGDAVIAIAKLRANNHDTTYSNLNSVYPNLGAIDLSDKTKIFDELRKQHYLQGVVPNPLESRQPNNNAEAEKLAKKNKKYEKENKPEALLNPFRDRGLTNYEIVAPDLSGDSASSSSAIPKKDKKVQGKLPSVRYGGKNVDPAQDLDDVRELVKILYNNKGIGAEINNLIEKNSDNIFNPDIIAGLHALSEDLKKVYVAKYKGNNLLRELKEVQTAEADPKSFGTGLNTLIKNQRMGDPENLGVDSISPLKLISEWRKRGWEEASLSGGTKKERDFFTNNTIHRVITTPIPAQEKRLIKNMLEASNREVEYYESSIKNLIEHGLVLPEKIFEISKKATLAKEVLHSLGDAANWVGQGIFAPPTRPEETRTWQKHVEYRNKLLQNYYRNLNPDRDGAFYIKYRELLQQSFSDSFYSQLLNEEEFKKMVEIVKGYADEQETEKFRNLDQLEKNLIDANQKILAKAEEIALKEDEIWKYKMLQMVIAFSPLAPLNVLNHIGDIIAPIKEFLDLFGVDTVIDWLLHDSPLKFVTETFDFAKDTVSPILNSASNLSNSPIAGLAIDAVFTLFLTDKWTQLNNLKKQADEESKKLNKSHLKTANESVEKWENSKITEYAKRVVSELDQKIKNECVNDKESIKDTYFKKAKELKIPHYNLVRKLQSEGFKEDDVGAYTLVKRHCDRIGANFESLYGPKAKKGITDPTVSDSKTNQSSKKDLSPDDFSEEEKDKIREKAKELQEMYRKQEDKDIEQIKSGIIKYVENSFDRSGTSRPAPDKNLLQITDRTIPKPYDIESRPGHENFNKTTKSLNNERIFIGKNFSG